MVISNTRLCSPGFLFPYHPPLSLSLTVVTARSDSFIPKSPRPFPRHGFIKPNPHTRSIGRTSTDSLLLLQAISSVPHIFANRAFSSPKLSHENFSHFSSVPKFEFDVLPLFALSLSRFYPFREVFCRIFRLR